MDKRIKWGIIVLVGAGLTALGIHTFLPERTRNWLLPRRNRQSTKIRR